MGGNPVQSHILCGSSRVELEATFFGMDDLDLELLLALAWAAPLTTAQLHRLVVPQMTLNGFRAHLNGLAQARLVEGTLYYRRSNEHRTRRIGRV